MHPLPKLLPQATGPRLAMLTLLLLLLASLPSMAAPLRDPLARGTDCSACHREGSPVLPARHKAVAKMKWADCLGCHERRTPDSLVGKLPGSHAHQLAGVGCADCYGKTQPPQPVEVDKCLSCHGSGDKVAALTAKLKPQNPHVSRHHGTELDCNLCHRQHEKSEDYCAECHHFDFKVP